MKNKVTILLKSKWGKFLLLVLVLIAGWLVYTYISSPKQAKPAFELVGHSNIVNRASYSPDGIHIITASDDETARVWDTNSGKESFSLTYPGSGPVIEAVFSLDGRKVAILTDDSVVRLWDFGAAKLAAIESPTIGDTEQNEERIKVKEVSSDNVSKNLLARFIADAIPSEWIAASDEAPKYEILLATLLVEVERCAYGETPTLGGVVRIIRIQRDVEIVVTDMITGSEIERHYFPGVVPPSCPISLPSNNPITTEPDKSFGDLPNFTDVKYWLISTMRGKSRLPVVNIPSLPLVAIRLPFTGRNLRFSLDGKVLFLNGPISKSTLWDTTTGEQIRQLDFYCSAFSPDEHFCVRTDDFNRGIVVMDVVTGEQRLRIQAAPEASGGGGVTGMAYSPDGHHLLACLNGTIGVWDVISGEKLLAFDTDDALHRPSYSPNGRYIVTATNDRSAVVRVWDASNGRELFQLRGPETIHVLDAKFSPDGRHIVTAHYNGAVVIWDVSDLPG